MSTLKTTNIAHPSSASNNIVLDSSGNVALQAGSASTPALQPTGDTNTGIFFPAADTIAFAEGGAEAARIDSSGRLLVGTSTVSGTAGAAPYAKIQVEGNTFGTNGPGSIAIRTDKATSSITVGNTIGQIAFAGTGSNGEFARIDCEADATAGTNDYPGRLVFSTTADGASSPVERLRLSNEGICFNISTGSCYVASTTQGAGTGYHFLIGRYSGTAGTPNSGTVSINIYSNGNITNTNNSYAGISDIKLKENVVDANSQWNDLKALQVRKYNFKEGQTHTQIGLIAQEVELVSPGLVTESLDRDAEGNDLGTVTKSVNYSVLYMKAVKALQEAMERIEQLEAKVAALEAA